MHPEVKDTLATHAHKSTGLLLAEIGSERDLSPIEERLLVVVARLHDRLEASGLIADDAAPTTLPEPRQVYIDKHASGIAAEILKEKAGHRPALAEARPPT